MAARNRRQVDYSPSEEKVKEVPKEQSVKSKKKRVIEDEDIENVDPQVNEENQKSSQKEKVKKQHINSYKETSEEELELKKKKSAPSSKESTKRPEEQEKAAPKSRSSDVVSQEEYQHLKTKYEELKNIRVTEVERLYEELKKSSKEKEETLSNLLQRAQQEKGKEVSQAKHQKEISKLNNELSLNKIQVEELQLEKKRISEKTSELSNIARFFGMITGSTVSRIDEDKYECLFVSTRDSSKVVKLVLSWNEEEIECTFDKQLTSISLPDYFSQTICFEPKELPPFLQQILLVLYRKD